MVNRSSKEQTGMSVRLEDSCTAPWSAAGGLRLGLRRADKGADEFALDLRADDFGIKPGRFEEFASFPRSVNAGSFDLDRLEARAGKLFAIFVFFQRACNAPNPKLHTFANV